MKYTKEELDKLIENAPKDEKGRPVISEEDFMDNLKDLPKGIMSEGRKISTNCGGYLQCGIKGDPKTYENCAKGGQAAAENWKRRKTFAESITILLNQKCGDGQTMQDKIVAAMAAKATDGCVGAAEFLRDTVGEKPTENMNVDVMTDGDKALMQKLLKRMGYDEGSTTE